MYRFVFKRLIDFLGALVLLLLLSPLLLIVFILELIFHGYPPIFSQKRVGKNAKIFRVYKFRSMTNKRDENGELLPDKQRLTKFGKFIRRTSIDELPQLFNILLGNMSFIGPRARDVRECVFLTQAQCGRFRVKPGISGLAQVNGRNSITFDKVAEFDNKYADKVTFLGDIKIMFQTFFVLFKRKGINSETTDANNLGLYYGEMLLRNDLITQEEHDRRISYAKSLNIGDVMMSACSQDDKEEKAVTQLLEEFKEAQLENRDVG